MPLKCSIIGLPNAGKTTLFNCLSSIPALAAPYPFSTKDPNRAITPVPDSRLTRLAEMIKPQLVKPAHVEVIDVAGLVKGASKGEGLGNQFLSHIRETDLIIHLIRCFEHPLVAHVEGKLDPIRDKEIVEAELLLKDIETLDNRIMRNEKAVKAGDKNVSEERKALVHCRELLAQGIPVRRMAFEETQRIHIEPLSMLSAKPEIIVMNVEESAVLKGNQYAMPLEEKFSGEEVIRISAEAEAEIARLEQEEDRMAFLAEMGLKESGAARLIRTAYRKLGLITFYTVTGGKEVSAWAIPEKTTAVRAAGKIHSDLEKGFIRAEIIRYDDFIHYGSEASCRQAGKITTSGRDYLVHDGDIVRILAGS